MGVVPVKHTGRAIMILRMGGIYRVVHSLVKDKGDRRRGKDSRSSRGVVGNMFRGGLIDCCKVGETDLFFAMMLETCVAMNGRMSCNNIS